MLRDFMDYLKEMAFVGLILNFLPRSRRIPPVLVWESLLSEAAKKWVV